MMRFVAGIVATLIVQAIGWPALEGAAHTARAAVRDAYRAAVAAVEEGRR